MLAKRLIYAQSQSMDAEEAMINRLKVSAVMTGSNVESSRGRGTVLVGVNVSPSLLLHSLQSVCLQLPWVDINAQMVLFSLYVRSNFDSSTT